MTTKSIFLAVALAATWLAGSRDQARAVAGYEDVVLINGYNFIANQFNATGGNGVNNSLTNVMPVCPEGTRAYLWDATNQLFLPPATFHTNTGWSGNFDLPPGLGFVVFSNTRWTNTFSGQVPQGSLTNFVAGANKFSLLASTLPIAGQLGTDLGFPGTDGDNVYLFRSPIQSYTDAFTYFTNYGWFDPKGVADWTGPYVNLGESFFVQNPGPDANWVQVFNPPAMTASKSLAPVTNASAPDIRSLSLRDGKATLIISNPGGGQYDVQFSSDGRSWNRVAKQTSATWSGAYSGGRGFFRVVRSVP